MLRPAKNKQEDFEDYAHWVIKRTGHCLHSPVKNSILEETELEVTEPPVFEEAEHPVVQDNDEPGLEPKVTFVKEGDIVSHIDVRCKCGEMIRIDLAYQDR